MNEIPLHPANASLVLCPDGPILVRGDFDVVMPSGEPVPRQRKTVALCRCGASAIKPYCDGTHKMINFRTEPPDVQGRGTSGRPN
ncbi:CDGSH iron-sulfur domain-containing protein [Arthrobacter sp. Leaf69]|uniref:CDGSH iron-sulfur domain-containing protein n=1 Tax=Arthrobacter sp. Leaf69 TaxID=1736232 RepID=UPI0006FFC1C4|nr:CDGSH iron-sulfur domain-containing protein [Arthrobacter sp. Leaf69]KQN89387.1 iron-binding protein [Arthrobacter sp. Leaf69]